MYPPINNGRRGWRQRGNMDWREGLSNWTIAYPGSDRHISAAVRGLISIPARLVSQSIRMIRMMFTFDGYEARWRGIYDDQGRLMVAICHNMDLGGSWEHADNPQYPEKYSALGIRIGVNYVLYSMTH